MTQEELAAAVAAMRAADETEYQRRLAIELAERQAAEQHFIASLDREGNKR